MNVASFIGLIHNAALLMALAIIFDVLAIRWRIGQFTSRQLPVGVLIGGVGTAIMLTPWELSPGVFFDTRSVLLGVAGLFFGAIPTLVAMLITSGLRLYQGGAGAWTGVSVILATGTLGILWRHLRRQPLSKISWKELYLFGVVLHLVMLALMLTLPWQIAVNVLSSIGLPVMVIFPLGVTFLGLIMSYRLQLMEMQENLRRSSIRLNTAQQLNHVGGWEWDVVHEKMFWTDETYRIHGLSPAAIPPGSAEHIQKSLSCYDPEDRPIILAAFQNCVEKGRPYDLEFPLNTAQGKRIWIRTLAEAEYDKGKMVRVIGTIMDITAQKQAEMEIRANELKLRTLLDIVPLGISILDTEHKLVYANAALEKILSLDKEALLRGDYQNRHYIRPDGSPMPTTEYASARVLREQQAVYDVETGIVLENGQITWTSVSAVPLPFPDWHVMVVTVDITHRKEMEEALRASEEKYRLLLENQQDLVVKTDVEGRFLFANPAYCQLFGQREEDLLGKTYTPLIHEDDQPLVEKAVANLFRPPNTCTYAERANTIHGWRWIEWNARALFDNNHDIIALVGTGRDITERKKGEEQILASRTELQRLLEEARQSRRALLSLVEDQKRAEEEKETLHAHLLQAQKMESIGRLAGGMAHDFNNLLGVIMGHAETALTKIPAEQAGHQDLREILKASRRSADLIRQLLAFARKEVAHPQVLDLNDTIANMLKMLKRLIGEDIELIWHPGEHLKPVKIDPSQVDQILANLLVNARDAITGVGRIMVETANVQISEAESVNYAGMCAGEFVLITVSDTGSGMDAGTLTHLFEPFFTTKEVGKGTGLGLATVFGIVKQNNGNIYVDSQPCKGTTFRIFLPACEPGMTPITKTEMENTQPACGSETILMVEDEEALLELGVETLEELGYTVMAANSPKEALRLTQENNENIKLLITDVVMPGMNGKELYRQIKLSQPEIKCLFMSGYTADIITSHGVIDEDCQFIQKPFMLKDLADKVRQTLENKK